LASISNILIARQPILKRNQTVYGYELLFRPTKTSTQAQVINGDDATTQVIINTFADIGLSSIVSDHKAFINITSNFLSGKHPVPLPPDKVVLEILEEIQLDSVMIDSIKEMKKQGYVFALDDVISLEMIKPALKYIQFAKVDMLSVNRKELPYIMNELKINKIISIAEKIETQDDFRFCAHLGFQLFQGYFFCKPIIVEGKRLETSRLIILRSLASLQNADVKYSDLERIVAQDTSLGDKLLNLVNSAQYGLPVEVKSLRQAISLIGITYLRGWMSLLLMASLDNKPHELTHVALMRARMAELLSKQIGEGQPGQNFLVGLFSVLDALMDMPMDRVLEYLPLDNNVRQALLHRHGGMGKILKMIVDYEHGQMDEIQKTNLRPEIINEIYLDTLCWTDTLEKGIR
jgi:EAL and modified HD-GYP domain-containing signal transduction protein